MLLPWRKAARINAAKRTKKAASPRRRPSFVPLLECLEDRVTPAGLLTPPSDVLGQFNALKHHGEAIGWILPEADGAPDPSIYDHYDGLARNPGQGTPIVYVT